MSKGALRGAYYTTTGLDASEKAKFRAVLDGFGAHYLNNLQTSVTILVVGRGKSQKLKHCMEKRDNLTYLHYSHIKKLTELLNNDTDVDRAFLDRLFPWPIFKDKLLCPMRLLDVDTPVYEKAYLINLIEHFGGKVSSNLSDSTNYLVTVSPYGGRFTAAVEWGKPVVHPKWVIDCCNCSRLLDTGPYIITKYQNPKDVARVGMPSFARSGAIDYAKVRDNYLFSPATQQALSSPKGLFEGFTFSYLNFTKDQEDKLCLVIKEHGGEVNEEADIKNVAFMLVPSTEQRQILSQRFADKILSEWFIERCLHYNRIIIDSWSIPRPFLQLKYKFKVHITGFGPMEHAHLRKLIINLGLIFSQELTSDCNFLVSNLALLGLTRFNSPQLFNYKFNDLLTSRNKATIDPINTKRKINSAKKWDIPVVSIAFIWELSQLGVLPDVLDPTWCIFAPQSLKPAPNFLEYARSISSGTFQTQKKDDGHVSPLRDEDNERVMENDISQHNSPTKILTFSSYGSPIKRSRLSDSQGIAGNKLNLKEWGKRIREPESDEETTNWWLEPDSDLVPVFKRQR